MNYDYLVKICVVADKDVGKETLAKSNYVKRFDEISHSSYMMTRGVDFASKRVELRGKITRLQLWIISDDKYRFQGIRKQYIKGSLGVILMYDISNEDTLHTVSEWIQMIRDWRKDIPLLLVGNKLDLEEQREVSKDQVDVFKETHDISSSMEISLKTGENIEKIFTKITEMSLEYSELEQEKVVHIENIFCARCGKRLGKEALFCNTCGKKTKKRSRHNIFSLNN